MPTMPNFTNLALAPAGTPSARTLILGTAVQPNTSHATQVIASVNVVVTLTGAVEVQLQTSPDNVTWTMVGRLYEAVSLALTVTIGRELRAFVPAGAYYRIAQTTGVASAVTIVGCTEIAL